MKKPTSSKYAKILLILAILTSPLCCFSSFAVNLIPNELVPNNLDFFVNLFEEEFVIDNQTEYMLYLTPITTTRGYAQVIVQSNRIRQRNFPVRPGQSLTLQYDMADSSLSGLLVCLDKWDCFSTTDVQNKMEIHDYSDLEYLDSNILDAVQNSPSVNISIIIMPILSLLPIIFFTLWLKLKKN